MSSRAPSVAPARPALLRLTPQLGVLCLASAVAWGATAYEATVMGNGPGTMGLGAAAFVALWALMMAAMMLPSAAPLAAFYARAVRSRRATRLATFSAGYLIVWAVTGLPAYALMTLSGAVTRHPAVGRVAAAALLLATGLWQLSGAKDYCLERCRSPIGLLVRYSSYRGRLRDLRAAAHHAGFCLGCCWALMVLFVVFGMMNLAAMLTVAGVVLLEKLAPDGRRIARLVALACFVLAVVVAVAPGLAPGLQPSPMHMT